MSDILDRLHEAIATNDCYLVRSIVREADGSGDVNVAEVAAELHYEYLSSREYGSRSWETMDALYRLEKARWNAGKKEYAIEELEKLYSCFERFGIYKEQQVYSTIKTLLGWYMELRLYYKAVDLCQRYHARLCSKYDPNDVWILNSFKDLTETYIKPGNECFAANYGENDPDHIWGLVNLARYYSDADRNEESHRVMQKAYELSCSVLGSDHLLTVERLELLAGMADKCGRTEEALGLMDEVVAWYEEHIHGNAYYYLKALSFRELYRTALGRFDETEEVMRLIASYDVPTEHPVALENAYVSMARFEKYNKQLIAAREYYIRAVRLRENVCGKDSRSAKKARSEYKEFLRSCHFRELTDKVTPEKLRELEILLSDMTGFYPDLIHYVLKCAKDPALYDELIRHIHNDEEVSDSSVSDIVDRYESMEDLRQLLMLVDDSDPDFVESIMKNVGNERAAIDLMGYIITHPRALSSEVSEHFFRELQGRE